MFVIQKDIFLITIVRDVSKWYDKWYTGNINAVKGLHLYELLEHYDPKRFRDCEDLSEERVQFLVEVQEIMNEQVNKGGCGAWMF